MGGLISPYSDIQMWILLLPISQAKTYDWVVIRYLKERLA